MDNLDLYFPFPATESPAILMERSPMIVGRFLKRAVQNIDREFGAGYAKEHPELVGDFVQASVAELNARAATQNFQVAAVALLETLDGFFDLAFAANKRADRG